MIQEVHLHDCLLHIHGLHDEALRLHERELAFLLLYGNRTHLLHGLFFEAAAAETLGKARLLLANLTLKLLDDEVDGGVHIHRGLLAPEQNTTRDGHSDFDNMASFGNREEHRDFAHLVEILRDLADTLLDIILERRGDLNVFPSYRECGHSDMSPFLYLLLYIFSLRSQNPSFGKECF